MDEFVAAEWERFDIDCARYELFSRHVTETAEALTFDEDDRADVRGRMWLACLEIRTSPPKDYPAEPNKRDKYCKKVMSNAALRCLYRELPDGPILRAGYVDPDRITASLPDSE